MLYIDNCLLHSATALVKKIKQASKAMWLSVIKHRTFKGKVVKISNSKKKKKIKRLKELKKKRSKKSNEKIIGYLTS